MVGRLIVVLAVLSALASASPFLVSDFNDGTTQDWTVYAPMQGIAGGTGPFNISSGGVADSPYLETEDTANGSLFFVAPSWWSGDYLGEYLTFTLRNQNPNTYRNLTSPYLGDPVVRIDGAGLTLYYYNDFTTPGASTAPGANLNWTNNSILLEPGPNWSVSPYTLTGLPAPSAAEVTAVLSDITGIYILADWVSAYYGRPAGDYGHDITGLDDVTLGTPEPGTILLTGVGLAFACLRFRRRGRALPR